MNKFKITVYQLDSKKRERIIDIKTDLTRTEAEIFIKEHQAEPIPYEVGKKKQGKTKYYQMSHE